MKGLVLFLQSFRDERVREKRKQGGLPCDILNLPSSPASSLRLVFTAFVVDPSRALILYAVVLKCLPSQIDFAIRFGSDDSNSTFVDPKYSLICPPIED